MAKTNNTDENKSEDVTLTLEQGNKQLVIDKVPNEIEIVGIGINRAIYIKGKRLDITKSHKLSKKADAFNWGYEGTAPTQLAIAILNEYLPGQITMQYQQILKLMVIAKIELNNFKMTLRLKLFFKDMLANKLQKADDEGVSPYFSIEEYEPTEEDKGS